MVQELVFVVSEYARIMSEVFLKTAAMVEDTQFEFQRERIALASNGWFLQFYRKFLNLQPTLPKEIRKSFRHMHLVKQLFIAIELALHHN
jgi:DNA-binding transcriptional regulator PaaX